MDANAQQARIDEIRWYHEFDFGQGLKSRSTNPAIETHRAIWRFIEQQLDKVDFRDKTVLDIGCWDGYWSFFAERHGARSVLATDDGTQHWADGRGLLLAKELYQSNVEVNQRLSVYDLQSLGRKFDVILMLGVYYHLLDPFYAFAQVRHCCHPHTLVLIEGNEGLALPRGAAILDPNQSAGKYLPTREALHELLQAAYFTIVTQEAMEPEDACAGRLGWGWRLRVCAQALLGSRFGVARLLHGLTAVRRVFLVCTPFTGRQERHRYKPPFGLHVYDERFGETSPA